MFESLGKDKKIDIGKLHYENPKKKEVTVFDLEEELTEEIWQKIITLANKYRETGSGSSLACLLSDAKIAFPSRFHELKLVENDWEVMRKEIELHHKSNNHHTFEVYVASGAKILFPEHAEEIIDLLPCSKVSALGDVADHWTPRNLKILYPEKTNHKDVAELEANIQNCYRLEDWPLLAEYLASYKIIYPSKKIEVDLNEKFWRSIGSELKDDLKAEDLEAFLYLAMNIKLIAAKEIRITDTSFEVIMPDKEPNIMEEKRQPPIVRKF